MNLVHSLRNAVMQWQERFVNRFRNRVYPATFVEEVNEQSRIFFPLYAPPFFVSWWWYIPLDAELCPNEPLLPVLRVGLAAVGVIAVLVRQLNTNPKRHRLIAVSMMYYMIIATGIITGLSKAHPSYVGGFCFLITVLSAAPLQLVHLYTGLVLSLTAFGLLCWRADISFASAAMRYSFHDLANTVFVNSILSYGWMILRRNSYEKGRALQELNERMGEQQALVTQQNAQLAQLNAEKDEIIGIVSHDLKNPLTTVLGFADVMSSEQYALETREYRRFAGRIHEAAHRMQLLIQRLLDVNTLESGKIKATLVPLDLGHIVEDVVESFRAHAAEKNIRVACNLTGIADGAGVALADETFLNQTLDNLLSNALKYSPVGKNVWIDVQRGAALEDASAAVLRISMRDEGPGFSDDDKAKLFGKFTRLSAQPTGGESSTGLGLSIVKKLVEAMDGRVWCESEFGKGATFVVELPAAERSAYAHP
jgi:signal transduction histidine kinase